MKILKCYPFKFNILYPPVLLVEGFKEYDGLLGDKPGDPHRGIDYARIDEKGRCLSFEVFSVHDGFVFQGISKRGWGRYVIIYKLVGKYLRYATVYAHLRKIDEKIPIHPEEGEPKTKGLPVKEGRFLGRTGISGWTKRKIQLHFELHLKNLKTNQRRKLDPYGIYDRYISGKYPQPGESLRRCEHYWTSNKPPFADEV